MTYHVKGQKCNYFCLKPLLNRAYTFSHAYYNASDTKEKKNMAATPLSLCCCIRGPNGTAWFLRLIRNRVLLHQLSCFMNFKWAWEETGCFGAMSSGRWSEEHWFLSLGLEDAVGRGFAGHLKIYVVIARTSLRSWWDFSLVPLLERKRIFFGHGSSLWSFLETLLHWH